jgi:hypothetical protein
MMGLSIVLKHDKESSSSSIIVLPQCWQISMSLSLIRDAVVAMQKSTQKHPQLLQ